MGNAARLIARHGHDIRYCPTAGKWLVWDGRRWQWDDRNAISVKAQETASSIYDEGKEATRHGRHDARLDRHITYSQSAAGLANMVRVAECEPSIIVTFGDLDAGRWLLNCANGTLDLRTGGLRSHNRDDLITKITDIPYDLSAPCDRWQAYLDMVTEGNQNLMSFLQRAVGYTLTGVLHEKCMFVLVGGTQTGKTTFIETISALMGSDYARNAQMTTLMQSRYEGIPNDVARLHPARLVTTIEAEREQVLAEAKIKQLTGGDKVTARYLYKEAFEFIPEFKIWAGTNHKPKIKGTDDAIWERIKIVPFTRRIPDELRDVELGEKLRSEEMTGILRWAVQGCLDWQRNGLGVPEEVVQATDSYRDEMDDLVSFIQERCVVVSDARVKETPLYEDYKNWCYYNGRRPADLADFKDRLTAKEFERSKINGYWHRKGIGLRDDRDGRDVI